MLDLYLFFLFFFFFNDTATTEIYTLSLHDALPISTATLAPLIARPPPDAYASSYFPGGTSPTRCASRSEEHTSELQSRENLVCRLLLEKKKKKKKKYQNRQRKEHSRKK